MEKSIPLQIYIHTKMENVKVDFKYELAISDPLELI